LHVLTGLIEHLFERRQMAARNATALKRLRLVEAARKLFQRVGALRALEADRRRRTKLERVLAERNRLAEEMARMAGPIGQIAHLISRIDACDREIRNAPSWRERRQSSRPCLVMPSFGRVPRNCASPSDADSEQGIVMIL
jgi:hypothetical protein